MVEYESAYPFLFWVKTNKGSPEQMVSPVKPYNTLKSGLGIVTTVTSFDFRSHPLFRTAVTLKIPFE